MTSCSDSCFSFNEGDNLFAGLFVILTGLCALGTKDIRLIYKKMPSADIVLADDGSISDINCDASVNITDLEIFCNQWLNDCTYNCLGD